MDKNIYVKIETIYLEYDISLIRDRKRITINHSLNAMKNTINNIIMFM